MRPRVNPLAMIPQEGIVTIKITIVACVGASEDAEIVICGVKRMNPIYIWLFEKHYVNLQ